jgi:hypothetical protein
LPDSTTRTAVGARSAIPACILAWLLPGAGHLYLGRTAKGLGFLGALGALFVLGVAMDAQLRFPFPVVFEDPLAVLRSTAQMAIGLPYLAARSLGFVSGDVTSPLFEYGNTFTEVGGLLNILVILDAHDVAVGRRP